MKVIKNLCKEVILEDVCCKFCYRLIETCLRDTKIYGVEVERKDFRGDVLTNIERDSIEFISPNMDKVEKLVSKLYKFEVSPIHLVDVIGEDVDDSVADFAW